MGQNLFFYALKTVDTQKTVLAMFLNKIIFNVWLDFMKQTLLMFRLNWLFGVLNSMYCTVLYSFLEFRDVP